MYFIRSTKYQPTCILGVLFNLKVNNTEKLVVEHLINSACIYALFSIGVTAGSPSPDKLFPLILGAGSTIAGQYGYDFALSLKS